MNSYLSIAAQVIRETRQPLSARQILRAAYQLQIVPKDLYGKTQHKTLHARLAEDILRKRGRSAFIRTDAGRFFLRSLLSEEDIDARYKIEYMAPLRSEQLKNFEVLCCNRRDVRDAQVEHGQYIHFRHLPHTAWTYRRLLDAEQEASVLYVRLLVILARGNEVLLQRSEAQDGGFSRRISLGITGYLKKQDRSLFMRDRFGIHEAALRTISERTHLSVGDLDELDPTYTIEDGALLADVEDSDLGCAVCTVATYTFGEDSPVDLALSRSSRYETSANLALLNDLSRFDLWSRSIISSATLRDALLPK